MAGWLPSMGYIDLDGPPDGHAAIDEAAAAADREPEQVRRLLNVNGRFGSATGFLEEEHVQIHELLEPLARLGFY